MALFQPSNIIPSTFAGIGSQTVSPTDKFSVSWQVNGNSAMTAFSIDFYLNSNGTKIFNTGKHSLTTPFYGIDNKGNPKQFTYTNGLTWGSTLGTTNTEYKMVITQYWKEGTVEKSITQFSGSIFLMREKPSIAITFTPTLNSNGKGTVAKQGFSATLTPSTTILNSVKWQFASVDDDNVKTILDDTGAINTNVLSYEYAGLFTGKKYAIKCDIETTDGISATSDWKEFEVSYTEAEVSVSNKITMQPLADDSVLLSWQGAKSIEGTLSPSGTPTLSSDMLDLSSGQSVIWNKVDGASGLNIASPYTIAWKGKIAQMNYESVDITARPIYSTGNATLTTTENEFSGLIYVKDTYQQATKQIAVSNEGLYLCIKSSDNKLYKSLDGISWSQISFSLDYKIDYATTQIIFGNNMFVIASPYNSENKIVICDKNCENFELVDFPTYTSKSIWAFDNDFGFLFAASGGLQQIRYASNPKTGFTTVSLSNIYGNIEALKKVGERLFVKTSYGSYGSIYSTDMKGSAWQCEFFVKDSYTSTFNTLVYGNNIYLFYQDSVGLKKSNDGINWELVSSDTIKPIVFGQSCFVATNSLIIFVSTDGINWQNTTLSYAANIILFSNNKYFTTSLGYYYYNEYTHTETVSMPSWWVKDYTATSGDNIVSATLSQKVAGTADLSITTKGYGVSVNFAMNYVSEYSSGTKTLSFDKGDLSGVKVDTISPSDRTTATANKSSNDNIINIFVKTPTKDFTTFIENVSVRLVEVFNDWSAIDFMTTDKYKFNIVKKALSDGLNGYSLQVYDLTSSSVIAQTTYVNTPYASIMGSALTVYGIAMFNDNELGLYLFLNLSGYSSYAKTNLSITQQDLASLTLNGKQLCDWVYISNANEEINQDFEPSWVSGTQFLADFLTQDEALQAGTATTSNSLVNALYRQDENSDTLSLIMELPTKYNQLKDYGLHSNQEYSYELFYQNGDYAYSKPIKSENVCRQYTAYTLIEAVQDSNYANVYHAKQVWRFGNNLSAGSVSNNNTPNWLTNFTAYRLRQPTARLGQSGTLQALLANYNQDENFYRDTLKLADELKTASTRTNTFFLKDMKGNLYMVGISGAITQTIDTKSKVQEITVSVPWEEVGDASNVAIIQLPDDEGWAKDGVMGVVLNISQADGKLNATYKSNYYGTTFALNNTNLKTSTPADVSGQVNVSLENGEVKATKES